MKIRVKFFVSHLFFFQFLIEILSLTNFTHITVSKTVTNDVTN